MIYVSGETVQFYEYNRENKNYQGSQRMHIVHNTVLYEISWHYCPTENQIILASETATKKITYFYYNLFPRIQGDNPDKSLQ